MELSRQAVEDACSQFTNAIVDDYPHAIIRLATHYDRNAEAVIKARLVFASVEFVPAGMPPPRTGDVQRSAVPGSRSVSIFYREVAVSTLKGLRWYRSVGDGLTTPMPTDVNASAGDGAPLLASKLLDEPVWPYLAVPFQDVFEASHDFERDLPFLASWQSCPRYHRRLAASDAVLEGALVHKRVREWLHRRLFVDLVAYPEFLGGLVLIAPNPLLSHIDKCSRHCRKTARRKPSFSTWNPGPAETRAVLRSTSRSLAMAD